METIGLSSAGFNHINANNQFIKMKKRYIIIGTLVSFFVSFEANAQQGFGTSTPAPSSVIDLVANNKGVLLPRIALSSTILAAPVVAPADALTVFNTATAGSGITAVAPGYYYWKVDLITPSNSKWIRLLDDVTVIGNDAWKLSGNAATTAGTNFLGTTDAQPLMFKTNNIKSGYISNLTSEGNIGLGYNSLTGSGFNSPGVNAVNNIGIGANTLSKATSNFTWSNVAIGNNTLANATDPRFNTAIGDKSQMNSTTGRNNVSVGVSTLAALTTGGLNTAVGGTALGAVTTGSSNNAFGLTALNSLTTGSANIAIGQLAGSTVTTGSYNTIIGNYNASVPNVTGNRQLNIGDLISGTGLAAGVFPETNATAQEKIKKVGIAQSSSVLSEVLDVNGTVRVRNLPLNGAVNSIYTQANGTTSSTLNQTFTATRTVVTDANGVLGYVAYLPESLWQSQGSAKKATLNTEDIYQSGSVAIGASTIPTFTVGTGATLQTNKPKLYVAGDISTTGKIYNTNNIYADYVFEKYFGGQSSINPSYEFKSLKDVRGFIKANNHLPGVTSIADLTKTDNGYVFDMTKLSIQSLEKLEELYLHVIEQQDKIDAQQAQIEHLERASEVTRKRLERLEKLLENH